MRRRTPLQERSRQRFERILEAAALVFAEQAYEAATMEAIAARAATSIGSVYQFFPNKAAVFDAVAARYVERARAHFDALWGAAATAAPVPWRDMLDALLDAIFAFHRAEPGLRAVLKSLKLSPEFVAANEALNREVARRAEDVLAREAPRLPRRRRALVARMIVEVVSSMLVFASLADPAVAEGVRAETKTLVRRWIAPYARARG